MTLDKPHDGCVALRPDHEPPVFNIDRAISCPNRGNRLMTVVDHMLTTVKKNHLSERGQMCLEFRVNHLCGHPARPTAKSRLRRGRP